MPCRYTFGFHSLRELSEHFTAHGALLGVYTEDEYLTLADEMFCAPRPVSTHQFVRPWNGDDVRNDDARDVFAIITKYGRLKTCYRPEPRFHGCSTNLDYYLKERGKA